MDYEFEKVMQHRIDTPDIDWKHLLYYNFVKCEVDVNELGGENEDKENEDKQGRDLLKDDNAKEGQLVPWRATIQLSNVMRI